jgi:hypothetical protein
MNDVQTRLFSLEDARWFAAVSGDPNPVHTDPEFASRVYPGAVVAHGLHLVLWALDTLPAERTASLAGGFKTVFLRPVVVGDEVRIDGEASGAIRLRTDGEAMATIKFSGVRPPEPWTADSLAQTPSHPPVVTQMAEPAEGVCGSLRLPDTQDELLAAFPNLGARLGPRALRGLAGLAPVSGAVLGGMTTEFSVAFSTEAQGDDLDYRVLSYHPALRRYELGFRGYGVVGKVAAIVGAANDRPSEAPQG